MREEIFSNEGLFTDITDKATNIWWAQISYRVMLKLNTDGSAEKSGKRYISKPIFVEAENIG